MAWKRVDIIKTFSPVNKKAFDEDYIINEPNFTHYNIRMDEIDTSSIPSPCPYMGTYRRWLKQKKKRKHL